VKKRCIRQSVLLKKNWERLKIGIESIASFPTTGVFTNFSSTACPSAIFAAARFWEET
jgi:hypothetical protein